MEGIIIKGVGGSYEVRSAGRNYICHAKGLLRYQKQKPLVGDRVNIEILDEDKCTANMIEILPRTNSLIRPAVANIDQAILEFAVRDPDPNLNLLDRFLLFMDKQNINVIIVLNKIDLSDKDTIDFISDIYTRIGYRVIRISTKNETGIEELKQCVRGKCTVLAGPSGVGKSSLINLLSTEEKMETGELSLKIMRGKNTTRHTQLICCGDDTFVFDTPGFSSIDIFEDDAVLIKNHFREFNAVDSCYFADCVHINEPDCNVKAAVSEGIISQSRYDNYVLFYKEVKNKKIY